MLYNYYYYYYYYQELSYDRFQELGDNIYYWRLPTKFEGNRLASYGGNLHFTLRFVSRFYWLSR